jgi:hypothetical protein
LIAGVAGCPLFLFWYARVHGAIGSLTYEGGYIVPTLVNVTCT